MKRKMNTPSERSEDKVSPGPHKKKWARRTWIHKVTGEEYIIEATNREVCGELFKAEVPEPREWEEKR